MSGKSGKSDKSPKKKGSRPKKTKSNDEEEIASEAREVTCRPAEPESPETAKEESTDVRQKSKEIASPVGTTKTRIHAADKAKATDQDAVVEHDMEENPVSSGSIDPYAVMESDMEENPVSSGSDDETEEKVMKKGESKYTSMHDKLKAYFDSRGGFSSGFSGGFSSGFSGGFSGGFNSGFGSGYATRQATALFQERERFRAMTIDEKRELYADSDYVVLKDIETWPEYYSNNVESLKTMYPDADEVEEALALFPDIEVDEELNGKVSLFEGDITTLEIDGIVNAANTLLLGGGGVDGTIHRAAGPLLAEECRAFHGCPTGEARTTCGYRLPAKYVIHTVGPTMTSRPALQKCYASCFREMANHNMKSLAFCCISTGIYGYPNELAVQDALMSTRKYLTELKGAGLIDAVDRIIFCLYMPIDIEVYQSWMQVYFPTEPVSVSD